jgi:hypothetical protein
MDFVKNFSDWKLVKESQQLNETVYSIGLGGNLNYGKNTNPKIVKQVFDFLSTNSWKKHPAGKFTLAQAQELAKMWNEKGLENLPDWAKSGAYAFSIKDGIVEEKNFLYETPLIVTYLDHIAKRKSCVWMNEGYQNNLCFSNSIQWAKKNDGIALGGIAMSKESEKFYGVESLIVHAFAAEKKNSKQVVEITIPNRIVAEKLIYWELLEYTGNSDREFSEEIWNIALSIEEGVKEYIKYIKTYETN